MFQVNFDIKKKSLFFTVVLGLSLLQCGDGNSENAGSDSVSSKKPVNPKEFRAIPNVSSIQLAWQLPEDVNAYHGIRIQRSSTGYPTGPNDGFNVYEGTGTNTVNTGLSSGITYYYSAYLYREVNTGVSISRNYSESSTASALVGSPGLVSITSSTADNTYGTGSNINITVTFTEAVTLSGGTLKVKTNTGDLISMTGSYPTMILTGTYTIGEGDTVDRLDTIEIELSGGAQLRDASNVDATLVLPITTVATNSNISIDTIAPPAVLTALPSQLTTSTSISVTVGGVDLVAYKYKLDGGGYSIERAIALPITASGLSSNQHILEVIGKDNLGNWQGTAVATQHIWTVDSIPPTAILSNLPANITNSTNISVDVDENDVVAYKYQINGGGYSSEIASGIPIQLSGLSAGSKTLQVIGKDLAGNWQLTGSATTHNWIIDTSAVAVLSGTPGNPSTSNAIHITVSGFNIVSYIYRLNSGSWSLETAIATPIQASALANQSFHTLEVRGKDNLGNWQNAVTPTTINWAVDTSVPLAVLTGLPANPSTVKTASITVQGSNIVAYKYRMDGQAYSAETSIGQNISLSNLIDANHTIDVVGKNTWGTWQSESSPTTYTWFVDSASTSKVRYKIVNVNVCQSGDAPYALGCEYNYIQHYFSTGVFEIEYIESFPAIYSYGNLTWAQWSYWGGQKNELLNDVSHNFRFRAYEDDFLGGVDTEDCTLFNTANSYFDMYDQGTFLPRQRTLDCDSPDNEYAVTLQVYGREFWNIAIMGSATHPNPSQGYASASPTFNLAFTVPNAGISGYHYKILTGTCSVSPSQSELNSGYTNVSTTSSPYTLAVGTLSSGTYCLYVRAIDVSGYKSHTNVRQFIIN